MKKYVKCFSNATEAMQWENANCDRCQVRPCYPRQAIHLGYITGHITWKVANAIGFISCVSGPDQRVDDYCKLAPVCQMFNKPKLKPKTMAVNGNELRLF